MNKRTDKRARLVEAADKLFFEQGVNITTLANIAALADVPLGNVYYYFKSKESIILAVIEKRRQTIQSHFAAWGTLPNKGRLKSFIQHQATQSAITVSFGDWLGGMCQELCKQGGEIAEAASCLLKDVFNWCEVQFKEMGKGEKAHSLALSLLSGLQGVSLLTLTFKDANVTEQQSHYLTQWLETI